MYYDVEIKFGKFGGCVPAEVPSRLSETSAGRVSTSSRYSHLHRDFNWRSVIATTTVSLLPLGIKIAKSLI